ncbi:MAG: hypothetical protein R3C11_01055 [Planctomycetaceae bacterium]
MSRLRPSNYEQLQSLEWLIGDWQVDIDSAEATLTSSNIWSMNQNFIISNFSSQRDGEPGIAGVQIIGWDPVEETIRSWIFDSYGGFGSGTWSENDGKWSLRVLYQTNEGEKPLPFISILQ